MRHTNHAYWEYQCDCGGLHIGNVQAIRKNNQTNMCSECRAKLVGPLNRNWKGVGLVAKDFYNSYERSARQRGLKFSVTMKYMWELFQEQDGRCALTGWPLKFSYRNKDRSTQTASLDRIDSTKGYVRGNLQWVHRRVNIIKSNMPNDEFITMCKAVANVNFDESMV